MGKVGDLKKHLRGKGGEAQCNSLTTRGPEKGGRGHPRALQGRRRVLKGTPWSHFAKNLPGSS